MRWIFDRRHVRLSPVKCCTAAKGHRVGHMPSGIRPLNQVTEGSSLSGWRTLVNESNVSRSDCRLRSEYFTQTPGTSVKGTTSSHRTHKYPMFHNPIIAVSSSRADLSPDPLRGRRPPCDSLRPDIRHCALIHEPLCGEPSPAENLRATAE
jgi:hypothetical protein